jgi:hypothetical protein
MFVVCQNISLLLTFFLPRVKKRNYQNPSNNKLSSKMDITKEEISMIDENKNKAILRSNKIMDPFF